MAVVLKHEHCARYSEHSWNDPRLVYSLPSSMVAILEGATTEVEEIDSIIQRRCSEESNRIHKFTARK